MECLLKAIRNAAVHNPDVQVAPACILWPDKDRQWEAIIPLLQAEMPELLVLDEYAPAGRTGPAIWLRCVIAGKTDDVSLLKGYTPSSTCPVSAVRTCGRWNPVLTTSSRWRNFSIAA